jgi:DNA polymerase-3 subunit gamma/tau
VTYEPFALKYRPLTFTDVVGQEAVAVTLRNSLREGRVANAFLFGGSRGVGKTSMARILAKALNCPDAVDGEPCGTCELCRSIARGDDIDVIEVDGASNRGIDEVRTIRDNVGYAPSRAKYKVYIIDEVHMLTHQAFNALLKTLEEPPPHVRFIFATTEPQAVLETIVSRCQRYDFRRISIDDIVTRLALIAEKEGLDVPAEVLREIAIKGEGGLRDSLGLLDQLVAFSGSNPSMADLDRVLGRMGSQILEDIISPLGRGEGGGVLDALDAAFDAGRDAEEILDQVSELFREAMVREARGLPGGGDGRSAPLVEMVRSGFGLDRLLFALRICLNTRREIKLAGQGRVQLELAFLKIARSRDLRAVGDILKHLQDHGAPPTDSPAAPAAVPSPRTAVKGFRQKAPADRTPEADVAEDPVDDSEASSPPSVPKGRPPLPVIRAEWGKVVDLVRKQKARAASIIRDAIPDGLEGDQLTLRLPAGADFGRRQLEGPGLRSLLEDAVETVFGHRFQLAYVVPTKAEAERRPRQTKVYEDPGVRRLLESFGGDVVSMESPTTEPE